MATDTELHFRELLITLDYLLSYATEDYPATQQAICKYAKEYGLHYEEEGHRDEIRRDRVGKCLEYLQYVTYKFQDKVPFVITTTDNGKYYVVEKNHLNEQQIIKILAAVKNDKYTKDEDTELLINRLLDSLANKRNRDFYKSELEKEDKRVRKYNTSVNRKMKLVHKAFNEKKSILIINSHFGRLRPEDLPDMFHPADANKRVYFGTIDEKVYCRVYRIEEHNNKPYAILIPLNQRGIIFDAVEHLSIPTNLPERELLMEDEINEDRLEELFQSNNKTLSKYYGSLDEYVEKQIMPEKGFAFKTSFYFDYRYLERIKSSFEEFFAEEMPVVRCNSFRVNREIAKRGKAIEEPHHNDEYAITCEPTPDDQFPRYGVVNIIINRNAFVSWLYNNPNIADVIDVVAPATVNSLLAHHYLGMLMKYRNAISDETIQKALHISRNIDKK